MLFLFIEYPDDDTARELTLIYDFYEGELSDELEWIHTYRTDSLTYFTSPNNMRVLLKTRYYCGFPLSVDVESWVGYNQSVNIGTYTALVVGTSDSYGHDSWRCMIGNQTFLEYDMDSGILVNYYWSSPVAERVTTLMEMNFEQLDPYIKDAGVLLAGIFVELAVIIWLLGERLIKPE